MRCKKHLTDQSSIVGVCASCLRERLFVLIAAQAQAQAQARAQAQAQAQAQSLALEDHRKSDPQPQPLLLPRSSSPYTNRRKSDEATWNHLRQHSLPDQRFYCTPLVGPTGAIIGATPDKKKRGRFSIFKNLFRSKSEKIDTEARVSTSNPRDLRAETSTSPLWFPNVISIRRKKPSQLFSFDQSAARGRIHDHHRDRGMSPAAHSEDDGGGEECNGRSSDNSSDSSQGWKQTPVRATPQARRGGRSIHQRNVSGLAFCLSPLVRASPSRSWNQKGMPPEMSLPGEARVPVKPHLSTAASFCANRSRKLADFGRSNPNH